MTHKPTPAPADMASESDAGEEDPGAALEMMMSEPGESKPAPEGKPSADAPLESPMPRSPTLENEEPELGHEEDIPKDDDAPATKGARRRAKPG